jgi:KDO2-lipid IV(A) lauroyltransferase
MAPLLRLLRLVFGLLPWPVAQALGRRLGGIVYRLGNRDRRRSLEHLALAFPELDDGERRRLALDSFRHLGTSLAELLHVWGRPADDASRHVEVRGFEEIERIRQTGKPILVLTGHCGNWELISCANHSHGLGLAAMTRELDQEGLQQISLDIRSHLGSEAIARGSRASSRQMLRTLRAGGALCMLIDQDIRTDGVWVPFFGRLAHTPTAAADIALRLGAEVVPTFSERRPDGSHRITFHPALDLPDDATEATARMTTAIENQVRRHPEQWVWMHRRWRRRPPGEGAGNGGNDGNDGGSR